MVDFRDYSHCALTYNGITLDSYLDNYMTVNVEGRQLFSPTLETVSVPGRDGDIVLNKSYPARDIKVHYLMQAKDNQEWLEQTKRLNMLLQSDKDVEFYFDDEIGVRYGQITDIDDPPYDRNQGIGTFTIHCQDPYLYSEVQESKQLLPYFKYPYYDAKLEAIEVDVNKTTNKIVISSDIKAYKIILNGSFKAGDKLVITPNTIKVNGANKMSWLDYKESDYHEFKIHSDDYILIDPTMPIKIKFRERVL